MRSDSGGGTAWRCGGVLTHHDRIDDRRLSIDNRRCIYSIYVLWFRYHSGSKEKIACALFYPLEGRKFPFRFPGLFQIPVLILLLRLGFRFRIPEVEQAL
jgi:hypothetical protein